MLIFLLGARLTYTHGRMVKDTRRGWAIFAAMSLIFFVGFATAYWAEVAGNPALALAGALAGKKSVPECAGTFTTHSPIFVALLIGVIVIVGALTFLPADALGPIVEHLFV